MAAYKYLLLLRGKCLCYKAFSDFKVFVIVITIDLGNSVVLDVHVSNVFDVNFNAVLIVITDLCHRISSVLNVLVNVNFSIYVFVNIDVFVFVTTSLRHQTRSLQS